MKTIEIKLDTAEIPTTKKVALIPQLLDKGALDWFQENKAKFNNSWSIFVEHFKRTFDSPNRARIAMQKLKSYTQSPYQDARSFRSEMRKLFLKADPQTSSTMKLEFLLTKVHPSYHLDLLKLKSKDPREFETMARDIEKIYLVNEAIEQNTQFNTSFSSSCSVLLSGSPHHVSSNYQQSLRYNNYTSNNWSTSLSRDNSSFSNKANYSPQSSSRTSFRQDRTPSYPSSNNQQPSYSVSSRNTNRQNLFNYQSSSSTQQSQLQPPLSTSIIPPLIPSSSSASPLQSQLGQPPTSATTLICQWCSQSGYSARDCLFLRSDPVRDGSVSKTSSSQPSKSFLLYAKLIVNNIPLQTLMDTGAATYISFNILQRMANFRYIDKTAASFVLADGVIPLQSNGSVELSMQFGNEFIKFRAFVIKQLCVDLIIGMDFLITFNVIIDVKSQYLSLEHFGRRTSICLDDQFRRPLIPLHARHATLVPPHSTVTVLVSTPISALSAYFIPTSNFIEHPYLSSTQQIANI